MSSFWDWEKAVIAEHDQQKPFAPENGQPLKFKPGDPVIFTNDAGLEFKLIVTGYYQPKNPDSMSATGHRYMLNWDCYWFPVEESRIRFDPTVSVLFYEAKSYHKRKPVFSNPFKSCVHAFQKNADYCGVEKS